MIAKYVFTKAIKELRKRKVIQRLIVSEGNIEIYKKEKRRLLIEIFILKSQKKKANCSFIIDGKYEIKTEEVLEMILICIMSRIDDFDLLQAYRDLPLKLEEVGAEKSEIARKMAGFLGRQGTFHGQLISMHEEQKLIDLFFK